jgi:hypothetical protein
VGGQSNASPLTPLGQQQAAALGHHLGRVLAPHPAPALVISSTAVRARDTARIMLQQREAPEGAAAAEVEETAQLLELDQGEWVRARLGRQTGRGEGAGRSGRNGPARAAAAHPRAVPPTTHTRTQEGAPRAECYTAEVLSRIDADPWNFAAPGGESQRDVEERCASSGLGRADEGLVKGRLLAGPKVHTTQPPNQRGLWGSVLTIEALPKTQTFDNLPPQLLQTPARCPPCAACPRTYCSRCCRTQSPAARRRLSWRTASSSNASCGASSEAAPT